MAAPLACSKTGAKLNSDCEDQHDPDIRPIDRQAGSVLYEL